VILSLFDCSVEMWHRQVDGTRWSVYLRHAKLKSAQFQYRLGTAIHRLRSVGWLRGTVDERWSLTGELSMSHARPAADG